MRKHLIIPTLIFFLASMAIPTTASANKRHGYRYDRYYGYSDPYYSYYGPYYGYPDPHYGYSSPYYRPYYSYSSNYIKAAQRILREEGLYYGPINGILNLKTRSALKVYQRRYDLRVTGRLDTVTLRSMGLI